MKREVLEKCSNHKISVPMSGLVPDESTGELAQVPLSYCDVPREDRANTSLFLVTERQVAHCTVNLTAPSSWTFQPPARGNKFLLFTNYSASDLLLKAAQIGKDQLE